MEKALRKSAEMSFEKVDIYGDPILSKVEHKKKTGELKKKLKKMWTTDDSEGEAKSGPDVHQGLIVGLPCLLVVAHMQWS